MSRHSKGGPISCSGNLALRSSLMAVSGTVVLSVVADRRSLGGTFGARKSAGTGFGIEE